MGQPAKWDQDSFRGYEDDDVEGSATPKANTNINWIQDVDENFRVRFLIQNFGGTDASITAQLQYDLAGGGWNNVTTSSSVCKSVSSIYFADADATTQQIGAGTFNTGEFDEASGVTGSISVPAGQETEVEFVIQIISGDVTDGQTLNLQLVTSVGGGYDSYTNSPAIEINEAAPALTITEADDLDSWLDARTLTLGYEIDIDTGNDLNNWSEALQLGYGLDVPGNDLNNLNDFLSLGYGLDIPGVSLNNWLDEDVIWLGYEVNIDTGNDLANWLDAFESALAGQQTLEASDDLDNWLDNFESFLTGFQSITLTDDLNNWLDVREFIYGYIWLPEDDLNNLNEYLALGYGLHIVDDLDNWNDTVSTNLQGVGGAAAFLRFRLHYGVGIGIGQPRHVK